MLDQLPGSLADDPEAVVLINLGKDGPQTSFQFVSPRRGVDDEGILRVAPRVVNDRVCHQGRLEFLIGQLGLFGKRSIGVSGVLAGKPCERGSEH